MPALLRRAAVLQQLPEQRRSAVAPEVRGSPPWRDEEPAEVLAVREGLGRPAVLDLPDVVLVDDLKVVHSWSRLEPDSGPPAAVVLAPGGGVEPARAPAAVVEDLDGDIAEPVAGHAGRA